MHYFDLPYQTEVEQLKEAFVAGARAALEGERPGLAEDRPQWVEEQWTEWLAAQGEIQPIEDLNLSVRAYNALRRAGCTTVGDVRYMVSRWAQDSTPDEPRKPDEGEPGWIPMYELRNVGYRTVQDTRGILDRWDEQHAQSMQPWAP